MKSKAIIGLVCATCFYGCATGSGDTENRINRLERQSSMLEKQLMTSETRLQEQLDINDQLLTVSAELRATTDAIRLNIQSLSGEVEAVTYSVKKGSLSMSDTEVEIIGRLNRVDEIVRTNKDRIAQIGQYLDLDFEVPAQGNEGASGTGVTPPLSSGNQPVSEAELYAAGKQAFDNGQYDIAKEKFQGLLSKYPKSGNADNSQFWLGEIYYREKSYEKAIMEYQKVIENYPDGNKVPASLLKQGLAFYSLNEQANARLILQEMINKYPTSNEAKIARDKLKTF